MIIILISQDTPRVETDLRESGYSSFSAVHPMQLTVRERLRSVHKTPHLMKLLQK